MVGLLRAEAGALPLLHLLLPGKSKGLPPGFALISGLVHVAGGLLASHNAIEGSCIVDFCPNDQARAQAFEQLFVALGAAVVLGPALGGELSFAVSRTAPFIASAVLSFGSLLLACRMPEYLPKARRHANTGGGMLETLRAFRKLLRRDTCLSWYLCASSLSSAGISSFLSARTIWARHSFGWDGREIGRVVACYGVTLVAAQFLLLPLLLWCMQGREPLLAQFCLLVNCARFTAYACAPSASWVYAALLLGTAGNCSVPVLQGLCSRCVAEEEHALLSGGASTLNTASQVVGALIGSWLFAASLQGCVSQHAHLVFSAACFALATACVTLARPAETWDLKQGAPSWVQQAEGLHSMDAAVAGPTARGSMLGRQAWLQRARSE
ncbi:unnamed protein product [Polarella glacialis]|uniref:Uncharacterized protein n=1 Tax=Polarella glacialis TaxID=89957 RepID=A0A813K3K2_POLGL|nr:unnamed protein product [Polarella glacialis]